MKISHKLNNKAFKQVLDVIDNPNPEKVEKLKALFKEIKNARQKYREIISERNQSEHENGKE